MVGLGKRARRYLTGRNWTWGYTQWHVTFCSVCAWACSQAHSISEEQPGMQIKQSNRSSDIIDMASPSYLIGCTLCLNGFQSKWVLAWCYYAAKALLPKKGRRVLFAPGVNGEIFPAAPPGALGLWDDPWWEQGMEKHERLTLPDFVCLVFLSGEENSTELWFSQGTTLLWPAGRSLQAADRRKLLQTPSRGRLWPHSLAYAGSCSLLHILRQPPCHISFPFLISKEFPPHLARSLLIIPPGDMT